MPMKNRIIRVSDEDWEEIGRVAEIAKLSRAGLIRQISAHQLPALRSAPDVLNFLARKGIQGESEAISM